MGPVGQHHHGVQRSRDRGADPLDRQAGRDVEVEVRLVLLGEEALSLATTMAAWTGFTNQSGSSFTFWGAEAVDGGAAGAGVVSAARAGKAEQKGGSEGEAAHQGSPGRGRSASVSGAQNTRRRVSAPTAAQRASENTTMMGRTMPDLARGGARADMPAWCYCDARAASGRIVVRRSTAMVGSPHAARFRYCVDRGRPVPHPGPLRVRPACRRVRVANPLGTGPCGRASRMQCGAHRGLRGGRGDRPYRDGRRRARHRDHRGGLSRGCRRRTGGRGALRYVPRDDLGLRAGRAGHHAKCERASGRPCLAPAAREVRAAGRPHTVSGCRSVRGSDGL